MATDACRKTTAPAMDRLHAVGLQDACCFAALEGG